MKNSSPETLILMRNVMLQKKNVIFSISVIENDILGLKAEVKKMRNIQFPLNATLHVIHTLGCI